MLLFFAAAFKPSYSLRVCMGSRKTDVCCPDFPFDTKQRHGNSNASCYYVCTWQPVDCIKIIEKRIEGLGDGGSYFLPETSEENSNQERVQFSTTLLTIDGYGNSGQLQLTLGVNITWQSNGSRWDDDCSQYKNRLSCEMFIDRTKNQRVFITKPSKTKSYDFYLSDDIKSSLLSKKMEGFPLLVFRNGFVEWSGIIQVTIGCPLDVVRFPVDEQACDIRWMMAPRVKETAIELTCLTLAEHPSSNSDWQLIGFHKFNKRDHHGCRIELRRRSLKLLATLVLPFVLFNLLVSLVYFLPPMSGEWIGYSVTLVLSFSVLVIAIRDMVPSTAEMIPFGESSRNGKTHRR